LNAIAAALRPDTPKLVAAAGILWTLVSTLDPARPAGTYGGPLLCLLALWLQRKRIAPTKGFAFVAVLSTALAVGALARPDFRRGDFRTYFAYLRSAAFDHDLDFANDYESWGLPAPPLTPTGHRRNMGTIGPALLWSPFFAVAHVYVHLDHAVGAGRYAPNGNSAPYLRSALAGTVTAAVLGGWLLVSVLERQLPRRIAVPAVLAAVATSPLLVYVFAEPGVAHGGAFGLACVGLWALDRTRREPSLRAWLVLGFIAGLMTLMRLQAAVFSLLFLPLAVQGLARRTQRPSWLAAAALAALLGLMPQLVAWRVIYGQWLPALGGLAEWSVDTGRAADVLFRPGRSLDPSSPHLLDVLFSADRGLFAWTPGVMLGLLGLFFSLKRWGLLGIGGVLVTIATAWFNGSYVIFWSAGDAFGARRFDIIFPFVALGYGSLLAFLARVPLVTPVSVILAFTLWNIGLAQLWRAGAVGGATSLENVALLQVRQLRQLAEDLLGRIAGAGGRALAYNSFEGRFFFVNTAHDGVIDLGSADRQFLTGGWSAPMNEVGPPAFRLAFHPRACARIPLLRLVDLEARITARAPTKQKAQVMRVTLNDLALAQVALDAEWAERIVPLPKSAMVPGENLLCLEFDDALPGPPGQRVAARVKRIVVH